MILPIVKYGHPVLRQKGARIEKITPEIRQLIEDMIETMYEANGVGLAAQQIGQALQLTVIDVADIEDRPSAMFIGDAEVKVEDYMPLVLLNPVLLLLPQVRSTMAACWQAPGLGLLGWRERLAPRGLGG